MSNRIYVSSLADYNNGHLHGVWIDCDGLDADDIQTEVNAMLEQSKYPNVMVNCAQCYGDESEKCDRCNADRQVPSAEEWAIHDYEGFAGIKIEEADSFERIAKLAETLDELADDVTTEAWAAWVDNWSGDETDLEAFRDAYQGTFDTLTVWAEDWIDSTDMLAGVPDSIARYFDFESWARDCECGGDIWTARTDSGLAVFNNN